MKSSAETMIVSASKSPAIARGDIGRLVFLGEHEGEYPHGLAGVGRVFATGAQAGGVIVDFSEDALSFVVGVPIYRNPE